jgi:predicted small lipoprotein YifL
MQTVKTILALLLCTALLGACGLKGPLYLPGEETPAESAGAPEADTADEDGLSTRG